MSNPTDLAVTTAGLTKPPPRHCSPLLFQRRDVTADRAGPPVDGSTEQVYGLPSLTKRYDDPIEVELAQGGAHGELRPLAFSWRGRRYAVQHLLKYWREAGEEWDPQRARDHECFRVEASDGAQVGVYDLRFDRLAAAGRSTAPRWRLGRIWD